MGPKTVKRSVNIIAPYNRRILLLPNFQGISAIPCCCHVYNLVAFSQLPDRKRLIDWLIVCEIDHLAIFPPNSGHLVVKPLIEKTDKVKEVKQVAQLSLTNPHDALHHDKQQDSKTVT